jgi:hypothetical protein
MAVVGGFFIHVRGTYTVPARKSARRFVTAATSNLLGLQN